MRDYKVKTIEALARGLEVLKALQQMHAASLHELHQATGIAKSTLTRILHTLHGQGYVWQRMADGAFLASVNLYQKPQGADEVDWLVEIASSYLEQLCEQVRWPSVLCVPRLDYMEVLETNRPRAYFDEIELGPVGFKVNMLRSASGRAYLSFCPDEEREAILQRLREKNAPGHELAGQKNKLKKMIELTRAQGYGLRSADFGGHLTQTRKDFDDGRESMAVPIRLGQQVIGCINLTWHQNVLSEAEAVARLLPSLQETVTRVEERLAAIN